MKERCIIITSHIQGSIKDIIDPKDAYIICADGGYDLAAREGITPDIAIGDFDSAKNIPDNVPLLQVPSHKDVTDTSLCIDHAAEKGFHRIFLIGGLGGRADHSIANIQNMVAAAKNNLSIIVMDEKNMVMAIVDDEIVLPSMEGWKLSLLSFSDECLGVTASGVAYPLENARLTSDYPLGTSNEIIKKEAFIKVKKGVLLLMYSRD